MIIFINFVALKRAVFIKHYWYLSSVEIFIKISANFLNLLGFDQGQIFNG